MTKSQKLTQEFNDNVAKINELLDKEKLTKEERTTLDATTTRNGEVSVELRAAQSVEGNPQTTTVAPDAEHRERLELRGRCSLLKYLVAADKGRGVIGAEQELQQEADVGDHIPLELFDIPEQRAQAQAGNIETRTITPAPGTTGINLDRIRPAVFAPSIADKLMVEMPRVVSGTYASATITTSQSAEAKDKSAAIAAAAGALTVTSATPKRIAARLELTLEDIATVGQANFESILRENLSLVLSDQLDDQMINGNGTAPNLSGMFKRLTDPAAPATGVETWERFIAIQAGVIDGLWASMLSHVGMVVNPETYRLMASKVRAGNAADQTALEHLTRVGDAVWTNKRMPDTVSNVAQGIVCLKGRPGMRTAVCPHWGYVGIDDIYTGSAKGERYYTIFVLVGDVILVQPDAYKQVAFRVST